MNSLVLLDTDVFSFIARDDSRAAGYLRLMGGARYALSFMSVAELHKWSLSRGWGQARRAALERRMAQCLLLNADEDTARLWARISMDRQRAGIPIDCADCWIAAVAVRYRVPLATHNARDYAGVSDLQIITSGA